MASEGATSDILKNELYFPSFEGLEDDHVLDHKHYHIDSRGLWARACTWCFLGEITHDETSQVSFWRNRIFVKDRHGKGNIPIAFYPERGSFDYKTLRKGHTICIMLAQRRHFLDRSIGIRIEHLDRVRVMPCALNDLFAISTFYSQSDHHKTCWMCKKTNTSDDEGAVAVDMKKCASCCIAQYCCKECQVKDWKERHRRWCKALPEFLKLTKILIEWSRKIQ